MRKQLSLVLRYGQNTQSRILYIGYVFVHLPVLKKIENQQLKRAANHAGAF